VAAERSSNARKHELEREAQCACARKCDYMYNERIGKVNVPTLRPSIIITYRESVCSGDVRPGCNVKKIFQRSITRPACVGRSRNENTAVWFVAGDDVPRGGVLAYERPRCHRRFAERSGREYVGFVWWFVRDVPDFGHVTEITLPGTCEEEAHSAIIHGRRQGAEPAT
jgi:hypothetical protein